jgi:hypothetical protein
MIRDHIMYEYKAASEFSSWSVSILFVLVHAIRKAYREGESGTLLYIMDTEKLQAPIYSSAWLAKAGNLEGERNLQQYAAGEYLVHGKLENQNGELWQAVELDELLTNGFWDLFPQIERTKYERLLLERVQLLREPFLYTEETFALDPRTYYMVDCLSQSFTGKWRSIFTLALVATRRRDLSAQGDCMTTVRTAIETGQLEIPPIVWTSGLFKMALSTVAEGKHFMMLLKLICDHYGARRDGDSNRSR